METWEHEEDMKSTTILDETSRKHYIYFVVKNSPAFEAIKRMIRTPYRPGEIIPVSEEELKSLEKDLLAIQVKENV